jgi:hypothetical protein
VLQTNRGSVKFGSGRKRTPPLESLGAEVFVATRGARLAGFRFVALGLVGCPAWVAFRRSDELLAGETADGPGGSNLLVRRSNRYARKHFAYHTVPDARRFEMLASRLRTTRRGRNG